MDLQTRQSGVCTVPTTSLRCGIPSQHISRQSFWVVCLPKRNNSCFVPRSPFHEGQGTCCLVPSRGGDAGGVILQESQQDSPPGLCDGPARMRKLQGKVPTSKWMLSSYPGIPTVSITERCQTLGRSSQGFPLSHFTPSS